MTPGIVDWRLFIAAVFGVTVLMSAACSDSGRDEAQPAERAEPVSKEERLAMRQDMEESRPMKEMPMSESSTGPAASGETGEVPEDMLDKIFADLEKQTGAQRAEFKVLLAEARQWNDGALGCPQPGEMYTQAIVDGYQVIIDYDGKSFDYHASENGFFKLCSGFRPNR